MGDGPPVNPWARWRLNILLKRVLPSRVYVRYVGRHEQMSMNVWTHLAERLPATSTVLDIGAFHGEYALAAREVRSDLRIVSFEPNPESLRVLRTQTAGRNIEIVDAALGATDGVAAFSLVGARSSLGVFEGEQSTEVRVATLDSFDLGRVGLVKIDVEGAEVDVLAGGRELFAEHRPVILCEVLRDFRGEQLANVLPDGYAWLRIVENHGLVPSPVIDRRAWRDKNWLLIPVASAIR